MLKKISKWYKMGLWSEEMVRNAVSKCVLTDEEAGVILYGN